MLMGVSLALAREQPLRAQADEGRTGEVCNERCHGANGAANPKNVAMFTSSTYVFMYTSTHIILYILNDVYNFNKVVINKYQDTLDGAHAENCRRCIHASILDSRS